MITDAEAYKGRETAEYLRSWFSVPSEDFFKPVGELIRQGLPVGRGNLGESENQGQAWSV